MVGVSELGFGIHRGFGFLLALNFFGNRAAFSSVVSFLEQLGCIFEFSDEANVSLKLQLQMNSNPESIAIRASTVLITLGNY